MDQKAMSGFNKIFPNIIGIILICTGIIFGSIGWLHVGVVMIIIGHYFIGYYAGSQWPWIDKIMRRYSGHQ